MTATETERLYDSLPGYMRDADEQLTGAPLLSFVSGIASGLQVVATLLGRLDHYTEFDEPAVPSDLGDADAADPGWLDWLAQTVGAHLSGISDLVARRDAVRLAPAGWRVGTKTAVADAARSALTGTRYVSVYDHSMSSPGDGGQWDVLLVTATSETPDVSAVLAAIVAKGAKPAGVVLHHRAYTATWTQVETAYGPAWSARNGKTWAQLQEAGL